MLDFFLRTKYDTTPKNVLDPKFTWLRDSYRKEVFKIARYYMNARRAVDNKNIFARLIDMLCPNIELSVAEFYGKVIQNSKYIARQFNFVNSISEGRMLHDIFYIGDLVVINDTSSNVDIFNLNYNKITNSPIRVVYSLETALDFYLMDLKPQKKDIDHILVVELDIHKLLMFYREWYLMQDKKKLDTDSTYFVYQDLYPRLMVSHLDIILFNRLKDTYYGIPADSNKAKHPFYVLDYTHGVSKHHASYVSMFKNTKNHIDSLLHNMGTFIYDNMFQALRLHWRVYNKQSEWAIWVARAEYIKFFLDFIGNNGLRRNLYYIEELSYQIKLLRNRSTNILENVPIRVYDFIYFHIEQIERHVGKR